MSSLLRELCKYARKERFLLVLYAAWIGLIAYVQVNSLAIASPSPGVRAAAFRLAECQDLVTLALVLGLTLRLLSTDPLYKADAFWRLRPITERALLGAKSILLLLIAFITPALVEAATLQARGATFSTVLTSALYTGLWHLAIAAPAAAVALLLNSWLEIGFAVALMVMGATFHVVSLAAAGHDSPWAQWVYPIGMVVSLTVTVIIALNTRRATEPVLSMLIAFTFGVPFVVFASKPILSLRNPPPFRPENERTLGEMPLTEGAHFIRHGVALRITGLPFGETQILLQAPFSRLAHLAFAQNFQGYQDPLPLTSFGKLFPEPPGPFPRPVVHEIRLRRATPDSPLLLITNRPD